MQLTDRTSLLLQVFHPVERQRSLREGDLPVVQSLEGPQELRGPGGHYALMLNIIDYTDTLTDSSSITVNMIYIIIIIYVVYNTLFSTNCNILNYYHS